MDPDWLIDWSIDRSVWSTCSVSFTISQLLYCLRINIVAVDAKCHTLKANVSLNTFPFSLVCTVPSRGEGECGRLRLKCDGTRAETRFRLSAKRTSPFKSAGASVQSTTGSRGVRISGSYAGYTMFRGSVKGTGYPLHSLPVPCVTVCHHISAGLQITETGGRLCCVCYCLSRQYRV
jgi:hypothetical protein